MRDVQAKTLKFVALGDNWIEKEKVKTPKRLAMEGDILGPTLDEVNEGKDTLSRHFAAQRQRQLQENAAFFDNVNVLVVTEGPVKRADFVPQNVAHNFDEELTETVIGLCPSFYREPKGRNGGESFSRRRRLSRKVRGEARNEMMMMMMIKMRRMARKKGHKMLFVVLSCFNK